MDIIKLDNNSLTIVPEVVKELVAFEEQKKAIDIREKEIKEAILNAMQNSDIKKFENDDIAITYIDETTRVGIDNNKLKEEFEDTYLKCLKESTVKSSVRIKIKNAE